MRVKKKLLTLNNTVYFDVRTYTLPTFFKVEPRGEKNVVVVRRLFPKDMGGTTMMINFFLFVFCFLHVFSC